MNTKITKAELMAMSAWYTKEERKALFKKFNVKL